MNKIAKNIINYRNELFGFSILSVMLFHLIEDIMKLTKPTGFLDGFTQTFDFLIGSIGVDIFVFLSGMGLYYSLSKSPKVLPFYWRRIKRIMPCYLICGAIGWAILDFLAKHESIVQYFKDLTIVSFWTDGKRLVWYVSFIMLMYFIFPLIFKLLNMKNATASAIILSSIIVAIAVALFIFREVDKATYKNLEVALWRILIFIIGSWYGKKMYHNEPLTFEFYVMFALGAFLKIMKLIQINGPRKDPFLHWFSPRLFTTFYTIIVLIAVTGIFMLLKKDGGFLKFMRYCGGMSLELYLIHCFIRKILKAFHINTTNIGIYVLYIAASFSLAIVLHKLTNPKPRQKRLDTPANA